MKAKKDPAALEAAKETLAGKGNLNPTAEQIAEQAYNTAMAPYGTGSTLQQGIQAATAAVQGLAGGDIAKAIAGASSPYLAEVIHNMTTDTNGKVNTEANLMAHAVVGAVVAQINGNSALAGAAGAVTGEYIAQQLYPGVDRKNLTEDQRQTISALGTLAAGLAGGIAGDSTADAVAGAQAGKNSSENNNMGATAGSGLGLWFGNTTDCDIACKAALAGDVAKGNAVVSAELAGTVGLGVLPGGAQIAAGIGGGANALIQYAVDGKVNYTDALIASWVGAATGNSKLVGTVIWNAAGGATSNYIKGDEPLIGAISSGAGASLGYAGGKIIQGPLEKVINPNWKNWEWIEVGMGISKPLPLSPSPAITGNIGASAISETGGKAISHGIEDFKKQR